MKKSPFSNAVAAAFIALVCAAFTAVSSCKAAPKAPDISDPLTGLDRLTNAGVRIARAGTVVYVDPIAVTSFKADADLILITHGHQDHYSVSDINKLSRPDTLVLMPANLAQRTSGLTGKLAPIAAGDSGELKGVKYAAFPSYNLKKTWHPLGDRDLGYSIISGGKVYCVPGDTDATPELLAQRADVLFLPCTATYTMTPEEGAAAANAMKPGILVPYHGSAAEIKRLLAALDPSVKAKELIER
jgi:L-ascorbate metabolism protein UlaG (beta-lactamase superfamily)